MSEGPPQKEVKVLDQDFVPERLVSDDGASEAMRAGKFEIVSQWFDEQIKLNEDDPTGEARINLTVKMAQMQSAAGLFEYAFSTLYAARQGAEGAGNRELVDHIDQQGEEFSRSDPAHRPWPPQG
jgi:hypothetical protein